MMRLCDFCGHLFPSESLARVLDFRACETCVTEMAQQSEEMMLAERLPG